MKRQTFDVISSGRFEEVPATPGVYFVLANKDFPPDFLKEGTGGRFKGKNPNVDIERLRDKWVIGAEVLYIGQSRNLRQRIKQYISFGFGKPVSHMGGRYIWQLRDAMAGLGVCWEEDGNSRAREREEVAKFEDRYGRLPFANLRH